MGEKAQGGKKVSKIAHQKRQKTILFSHNDFTENCILLDNIKIPKKYQNTLRKIKTGTFAKSITDTEKKLMEQNFTFQLDVFNAPANDSYQKELNKTIKQIVKVSGLNEIEERLGVLKMVKLISFNDFEASVKHLNDDRKEIGLKIRKLRKETAENSTQRESIIEKIGKLEKDREKFNAYQGKARF